MLSSFDRPMSKFLAGAPFVLASSIRVWSKMQIGSAHRNSLTWPSAFEMEHDHLTLCVMYTGLTLCDGVVQGGMGIVKLVLNSSSPTRLAGSMTSPDSSAATKAASVDGLEEGNGLAAASGCHTSVPGPVHCGGGFATS